MRTIFALASGRSGTHFLYELLRRNVLDCVCRHETYCWSNPSMFGRPIYDHAVGNVAAVRRQVEIKARWIARRRAAAYAETSHAFLKSWYDLAPEFFPDLRLVHLVRDVLKVAKSEANREALIHRWRVPFCNCRGDDGTVYFRWALTGKEPIFERFATAELTRFQWYVLQWIEIENRAMRMLDQFGLHDRCITLHSPHELNDPAKVRELLEFLDLKTRHPNPAIAGWSNATPGVKTVITEADEEQARNVVSQLPQEYLRIFHRPPYAAWGWADWLRAAGTGQHLPLSSPTARG